MIAYTGKPVQDPEIGDIACNGQILWSYCGVSEICSYTDLGEYSTYGIRVNGPGFSETLHDVSSCKEVIARMTYLFNKNQLSPIHFKDSVEDMIGVL